MIGYGTIQANGTVIEDNGDIHHLPCRGTDSEGYPEVLIDAEDVGGRGSYTKQSIKPFIGMKVVFIRYSFNTQPSNYLVLPNE